MSASIVSATPPGPERRVFSGPVMFWTVLTTLFPWLPLVRIMTRPEGYQWGVLGLRGEGTEGPWWIFVLLTLYVLVMLFSAFRGPRTLFFPMLVVWHLAVTAVLLAGTLSGGGESTVQGQGLGWEFPTWLLVVPAAVVTMFSLLWAWDDFRTTPDVVSAPWTRANTVRLLTSLGLLLLAFVLFRRGTNYDWVTAAAIVATVFHWIFLVESFRRFPIPTRSQG